MQTDTHPTPTNPQPAPPGPVEFYRLPRVRALCGGVAASTIWAWVKAGRFPRPVKLAPNTTAWAAAEVEAWAQARIAESRGEA